MIPVYILASNGSSKAIERYFDTSGFEIHHVGNIDEREQLSHVLERCPKNQNVIIIRDTSVSISDTIAVTISEILNRDSDFDVFYLCKWQDRCDLYRNPQALGESSVIVQSSYPQGIQAMILSPSGVAMLKGEKPMSNGAKFDLKAAGCLSEQLAKCIYAGWITAHTVTPNLFEFNVMMANKTSDMKKKQECLDVPISEIQANNQARMWSYIILFLIILLIAICIYQIVYSK